MVRHELRHVHEQQHEVVVAVDHVVQRLDKRLLRTN